MALIALGQSTCPLCGQLLNEGEDIIGLPPILNTESDLYQYFDCGFHKQCFTSWDKKEQVERLIELEQKQFQDSEIFRTMLNTYGPPSPLETEFVKVVDSFKLSTGDIVVFLKWKSGKLAEGTVLNDLSGNKWIIKSYVWVTGSVKTYEKIKKEEAQNIFQYLLEGVNEKPASGIFLKVLAAPNESCI